jgi:hypothetical protein
VISIAYVQVTTPLVRERSRVRSSLAAPSAPYGCHGAHKLTFGPTSFLPSPFLLDPLQSSVKRWCA